MSPSSPLWVAGAAALALATGAPALAAQALYWPSFASTPLGTPAAALVGAPDLHLRGDPTFLAKFERRMDYPTLAATLGLDPAEFARHDLLAWEANGGSPGSSGGWESAKFVFDDFVTAVAARYDEVTNSSDNPAVRFVTGSITGAQYDALHGTSGAAPVMSWLLVDLPAALHPRAPSFSVRVEPGGLSAGLGEGSPDIDAIGVIATVPEPATWGLWALGLAGLTRWRARRHPAGRV